MLAKQITSKLKQESDSSQTNNPSNNLNVNQCDRIIRSVSCKHDTNPTIISKKTNINVLQPYQETKLYISPHYLNTIATTPANTDTQQQQQQHTVLDATFSTKLKRRNIESSSNTTTPGAVNMSTTATTDPGEVNIKDLLDSIVENLSLLNISQWFSFNNTVSTSRKENLLNDTATNMTDSIMQTEATSMFDSIQQALNHIDFNLKRNSDFINELTKLLDTSKALKLESQMKKMTKLLDEEKLSSSSHGVAVGPASQPGSPSMRSTSGSTGHNRGGGDDDDESLKKKSKTKGFKLSTLSLTSKSVTDAKHAHDSKLNLANQTTASVNESTALLLNMEDNFRQLKVNDQKLLNSSDYNELEKEVEKISYELDSLFRLWTRVYALANQAPANNDQLKSIVEFQILIGNLNSPLVVKELDQALFKINWLITSKSGFYEPNWQSCVLSLTPSTNDSFVGVNLLKTYYKYVKYDFVSYKLFTRQLQLIQLCAIILNSIHRILLFYREIITLSSITNNLNGPNGTASDLFGSSLLSFNFSSDKYRPISWSANHVTLYNVQNSKATTTTSTTTTNTNNNTSTTPTGLVTSSDRLTAKGGVSRNSSTRRDESRGPQLPILSKEDQIRQIKIDVFIRELNDFLQFTTNRLNIQANMANRTGYFYIVNKSTGLVLQAADFTSDVSLKEHIEQNQKRLQNTSVKSGQSGKMNNTSQSMSKGPRFYLLPKIVPTFVSNTSNTPTLNKSSNEQPTTTTTSTNEAQVDEQLWYYYLINGCIANKIIRSGYCMAASSMNTKSPVCFWPNVKTTNCSWFYNSVDQTISSGLNDDLVLDYIIIDEPPNQRYAVVIDTKVPNKISQKWSYEFC